MEKSLNDIKSSVETACSLQRLLVTELNILIHHTGPQQNVCGVFVKLSAAKIDKVNALNDVIGDGSNIALNKFVDKVHSLTILAGNILMKKAMGVPSPLKDMLNVVCATSIYPHKRREWESNSTVKDIKIVTDDFEWKPEYWFSYPEYSNNHQQLAPKCRDAHHLFFNCRVKVCKDGLEGLGIKNDAWPSVASFLMLFQNAWCKTCSTNKVMHLRIEHLGNRWKKQWASLVTSKKPIFVNSLEIGITQKTKHVLEWG